MGIEEIKKLIATVSPDLYCKAKDDSGNDIRKKVKALIKEKGFLEASKEAKLVEQGFFDYDVEKIKDPFAAKIFKNPLEQHLLSYEAVGESLEPLYYWIIDNITNEYDPPAKLIDNFVSSPTSAHFAEMGQRATRMQEEAMKIFQTTGVLVKSILQIVYDLKEFEIRLKTYEDLHSKDKKKNEEALLTLKQIWMDKVDIAKGNSSIKGMAQQFDYVTLIDAFMVAKNPELKDEKGNAIDLNDRVKRILSQRISEFLKWTEESEKELRKRFEIEKIYLKNQVNSVKLYAKWVKPYLTAAKALDQRMAADANVVNSFNTSMMELVLLSTKEYKTEEDVIRGDLPEYFKNFKSDRKYFQTIILHIEFRSIPERNQQGGYGFKGKVKVNFLGFGLNSDELDVFKKELEKSDVGDLVKYINGATDESLAQLQDDLDHFLEDKKKESDSKKEKETSNDTNPFSALFSFLKTEKKTDSKGKKDLSKGIPPDNYNEKVIRARTIVEGRWKCKKFYNFYKKNYGMPTFAM